MISDNYFLLKLRKLTLIAGMAIALSGSLCSISANPKIVIIIDDFGYTPPDNSLMWEFLQLEGKIAVSVIPGLEFSTEMAEAFHLAGKEIILHLPLEAETDYYREPLTLLCSMPPALIAELLAEAIRDVPHSKGISNHQGSAFTTDSLAMNRLSGAIRQERLYFIDSFTSPNSIACNICALQGIPVLKRDLFLDCSLPPGESVGDRLLKLIEIAESQGFAVGIGHRFSETLNALRNFLNSPESERVELIFPSELLKLKTERSPVYE